MSSLVAPNQSLTAPLDDDIDQLTGTRVRAGNSVRLMESGVESYEKRWELLEQAEHSIHIVTFSLMRDKVSRRLRDVLKRKLAQGVDVRLILDDLVLYTTFSMGIVEEMEDAGVEVVRYNKLFEWLMPVWGTGRPIHQFVRAVKFKQKRRFHEKYIIVDGRDLVLGGMNWGGKYAFGGIEPKAWRDTDVHVTGPVVADVQRQFIYDFFLYSAMNRDPRRRAPGVTKIAHVLEAIENVSELVQRDGAHLFPPTPTTGTSPIRYLPHKPYDENRLRITDALLLMFNRAEKSILWGCHGIRPPRVVAETLAAAVARGVDVRLITNNRKAARTLVGFGLLGWMHWESSNHYKWLLEHGVRVFEWQKPGAFHSKALVVDGTIASVGSYNIARGSTFHHTESNVVVYDERFAHELTQQFDEDFDACKELQLSDAKTPYFDPFKRLVHERNRFVDRSVRTAAVHQDLEAGKFKRM